MVNFILSRIQRKGHHAELRTASCLLPSSSSSSLSAIWRRKTPWRCRRRRHWPVTAPRREKVPLRSAARCGRSAAARHLRQRCWPRPLGEVCSVSVELRASRSPHPLSAPPPQVPRAVHCGGRPSPAPCPEYRRTRRVQPSLASRWCATSSDTVYTFERNGTCGGCGGGRGGCGGLGADTVYHTRVDPCARTSAANLKMGWCHCTSRFGWTDQPGNPQATRRKPHPTPSSGKRLRGTPNPLVQKSQE